MGSCGPVFHRGSVVSSGHRRSRRFCRHSPIGLLTVLLIPVCFERHLLAGQWNNRKIPQGLYKKEPLRPIREL